MGRQSIRSDICEDFPDVAVQANGLRFDFLGGDGLAVVQAGVSRLWSLRSHLPEWVFDDAGSVHARAIRLARFRDINITFSLARFDERKKAAFAAVFFYGMNVCFTDTSPIR